MADQWIYHPMPRDSHVSPYVFAFETNGFSRFEKLYLS